MQEGLAAWQSLAAEDRRLADESAILPRHRWEDSLPRDGLIVHVLSRDLPEQCDPSQPNAVKWNQDYLWFSRDEARRWLGAEPRPGDVHALPEELVARLARFYFVDNVKGETPPFSRRGIEGSQITTEVTERDGSVVSLRISGETRGVAGEGWWQTANGVVTRVQGQATFDLEQGQFTAFEMVALGRRWGQTRFNGRGRDPQSSPLGYVLKLVTGNAPPIAPTHIYAYNADWIVYPQR